MFNTLQYIPTNGSVRTDGHGQIQCRDPTSLYVCKDTEIILVNSIAHIRIVGSHPSSRLPYSCCNLCVKTYIYIPIIVVILFLKTEVLQGNFRRFGGSLLPPLSVSVQLKNRLGPLKPQKSSTFFEPFIVTYRCSKNQQNEHSVNLII